MYTTSSPIGRWTGDAQLPLVLLGGRVTVCWWFSQPKQNLAVRLEAAILGSYAALSKLVFRGGGVRAPYCLTAPMETTIRVRQDNREIYNKPNFISPHTPLWGNPRLPHLYSIPDPSMWAREGITILKHIKQNGRIMPFPELKRLYSLSSSNKFK